MIRRELDVLESGERRRVDGLSRHEGVFGNALRVTGGSGIAGIHDGDDRSDESVEKGADVGVVERPFDGVGGNFANSSERFEFVCSEPACMGRIDDENAQIARRRRERRDDDVGKGRAGDAIENGLAVFGGVAQEFIGEIRRRGVIASRAFVDARKSGVAGVEFPDGDVRGESHALEDDF